MNNIIHIYYIVLVLEFWSKNVILKENSAFIYNWQSLWNKKYKKIETKKITKLKKKKKQATVIFFNKLEENSKAKKSSTLSYFNLHNTDDGIILLFKKHDKAFQSETVDKAYSTDSLFISWQRTNNMNISPLSANPTKWSDTLKQFEFVWPLCGIGAHRDRTRIGLT